MHVVRAAGLTIDGEQQLDFARLLFEQGQYRRAAEEYERFAFFFATDPRLPAVQLKTAEAYYLAGDGVAALERLRPLIAREPLDRVAVDAYFLAAESFLRLNNPNQAVLQLNNLILLSDEPEVKDRAYLRIGWIHIEQLDWEGGRRALNRITPNGRQRHQVDRLSSALDETGRFPRKSPALAGALSVVPGAGQLYNGRYQDALSAFMVNVGLFWAAYESFDNDLNALGGLLAVAGIGFYTGNIYSAISSAHKHNQAWNERFVDQLKHQMLRGSGMETPPHRSASIEGVAIRWHIPF
ncbi:MAG: tetratricopeptide repeat protein [Desulfatitalea sp.]|nr:tetratricopeptide repeat protein [Desulfatitalea sp.]